MRKSGFRRICTLLLLVAPALRAGGLPQARPDLSELEREFECASSAYAAVARYYLESKQGTWPQLLCFVLQDTHLNKWAHLRPERIGQGGVTARRCPSPVSAATDRGSSW